MFETFALPPFLPTSLSVHMCVFSDESSSEEEESSEDTAGFITEDVQYDTEIDELEEAELQLANDVCF